MMNDLSWRRINTLLCTHVTKSSDLAAEVAYLYNMVAYLYNIVAYLYNMAETMQLLCLRK